ncbi:MAG: AAA family ATPase [Sedimentisphaerales bacterium]|nr:AAA family ATPase [Sedimentisphaerales bacterium]
MAITNLKVSNFKSFKDLDLNLGPFNVVIGANAAGKSNFVEVFRFLKTLERENLDDAISLHGGRDSILNKRLGISEPLRMRVTSDRQMTCGPISYVRVYQTTYDFSLQFEGQGNRAVVKDDHFTQKMRVEAGGEDTGMTVEIRMSEGERKVEIGPRDLVERITDKEVPLDNPWLSTPYDYVRKTSDLIEKWKANELLLRLRVFGFVDSSESLFQRVGVHDIEPREAKKAHEIAGRSQLEENGENLALVLRSILADPEKSRKFHNLVRYLLPFVAEVGTEKYLGESVLLRLREEYYEGDLLANLLSDGTVNVVALIIALFFEDKDVVIIEEPERNIHPRLISGLVTLMKDAARNKQVIITTHSPEVVRHAGVENLLLLSRDKEGFSTVSKPAEKEAVKIFLKNELGLDELFVQDVLSI